MKYQEAYEKIKKFITNGTLGESGTRLISTPELSQLCQISFVNTLKIVHTLKDELFFASIGQKLYIANGLSKKHSDLRTLIGNSKKIGILIPSVVNPFYATITEKVSHLLQQKGYIPLLYLCNTNENSEIEGLKFFLENQCEGALIIIGLNTKNFESTYNRFPLPYVLIGKQINNIKAPFITSENYTSSYHGTKRLIEIGYEHFIFLHPHKNLDNNQRWMGFLEAIKIKYPNIENIDVIEYSSKNNTWKYMLTSSISKLEKDIPIGIFCYHDLIAFDVYFYLSNLGYSIPKKIGIMGYDDLPLSQIFNITTFSYSYDEIARQSVNCLIELIENSCIKHKNIQIQTLLITRNSTKRNNENV